MDAARVPLTKERRHVPDGNSTEIRREYARDKSAIIAKVFGGIASLAFGCCVWLFSSVLDLRERVIRIETREEIRQQLESENGGHARNYKTIKETP